MIEVIQAAPFNSIQDGGRADMRRYGLARGGVMDLPAWRMANLLAGNPADAAVLEIQMAPIALRFTRDCVIALTGADFGAQLDGVPLLPWYAFSVRSGQVLRLTRPFSGARACLAVRGGFDVPLVLGARATLFSEKMGGYQGRQIEAGDVLPQGCSSVESRALPLGLQSPAEALPNGSGPDLTVLRYVRSDERLMFSPASLERFEADCWTVSMLSNRMGFRLDGLPLERVEQVEMRSHGILEGVIQVPPSGLPLVQLADGNSAGGYPKMGVVCSADLWRLVQVPPGGKIRFSPVSAAEAAAARRELDLWLSGLQRQLSLAPASL